MRLVSLIALVMFASSLLIACSGGDERKAGTATAITTPNADSPGDLSPASKSLTPGGAIASASNPPAEPAAPAPSLADRALRWPDVRMACQGDETGSTYVQVAGEDGGWENRVFRVSDGDATDDPDPETVLRDATLFFDPAQTRFDGARLDDLACASASEHVAIVYNQPSPEEPAGASALVVLDGDGMVVAEHSPEPSAAPMRVFLAPDGKIVTWIGLDGAPRVWALSDGEGAGMNAVAPRSTETLTAVVGSSTTRSPSDPTTFGEPIVVAGVTMNLVSGAPGGQAAWTRDGRYLALAVENGVGSGALWLVRTKDADVQWALSMDGPVIPWFDNDERLHWATAPYMLDATGEPAGQPTSIELWRLDAPPPEVDAGSAPTALGTLPRREPEAVNRWFLDRLR